MRLNGDKSQVPWGIRGILLMATRNPANSPVEVGSLSHYLQRFMHPRWLFRISSINNMTGEVVVLKRLFLFVFEWIFFLVKNRY